MAVCTLDLSHRCFLVSLRRFQDDPEAQEALNDLKTKVEKEHTSCNRVVQQFYGNKKFSHLQNKIWKYDWGKSGAGRKSWRMVVIVPEPDKQPYRLIAGAIYLKSETVQLNAKELAAIFAEATKPATDFAASNGPEFHRVPNGDGHRRSICMSCLDWHAVAPDEDGLDVAEKEHTCPTAENEEVVVNSSTEPE